LLAKSETETDSDHEITEDNLHCPACGNETVSIFMETEVDYDESGPVGGYFVFSLKCRVCGIELDEDEIQHVVSKFEAYLGKDTAGEKKYWEQAITPPEPEDSY
jgi:transcription elongation factor Elf1